MTRLRDIDVLVLDCQAGGATPAHGDLLELGWAVCGEHGIRGPVSGHWIVPRTDRRVPGPIRELTGWSEACVADAVHEHDAWSRLHQAAELTGRAPAPTLIHFARYELTFLRDLHARLPQQTAFPFDALCLHAVSTRLFPELPRRNIRALAGYLGHSTELIRRSAGHVEATAFIWRAVVPLLEERGVETWTDLGTWLAETPAGARPARRTFPLAPERRRALPDRPGVYRFLRRNTDLLYVGKATSLKKRVAGHFGKRDNLSERVLELLTQVHDIAFTETASILEAALLESDEIKRLDPPYNVQLRSGERRAWFASRDMREAVPAPDDAHPIGPLPSQRALMGLPALIALAAGAEPTPQLQAMALAVPMLLLPERALFDAGYRAFAAEHFATNPAPPSLQIDRAARALWLLRGRAEELASDEDAPPDQWDLARVRRRLERSLVQTGLLVRRARWLCLLADADVAFRERGMKQARALSVSGGEIVRWRDLDSIAEIDQLPIRRLATRDQRRACFDAATYDRLRVLTTELRRVQEDGGEVGLRLGKHKFTGERLVRLTRAI